MSPCVVAGGILAPGSTGFGDESGGGLVVVAECLGDDGGRGLEDELADRGGPAALWRDTDLSQLGLEAGRVHRLPGLTAGEEPAAAAHCPGGCAGRLPGGRGVAGRLR